MLTEFTRSPAVESAENKHTKDTQSASPDTPVYAAKFMKQPAPKHRIPEEEMPAAVATRIIRDELELDGVPGLNLATFVSTWMEPEGAALAAEQICKNAIDVDEYPRTAEIQSRCVEMLGDLFNVPVGVQACGVPTLGSSEACLLGGLAMKLRWKKWCAETGRSAARPNVVLCTTAQVVWHKFLVLCDVEAHWVPISKDSYVMDVDKALSQTDENTIGVVMLFASTLTGEYEPVKAMADALCRLNADKGWDVCIHVDAASGGFVAPFIQPHIVWDFKLPLVRSINVSGHKYGLVQPGTGFIVWRESKYLPDEMKFHINYLGGDEVSVGLNFSRSGSAVIGQYYNFLRLGKRGYSDIMGTLMYAANYLKRELTKDRAFTVLNRQEGVPVVILRLENEERLDFSVFDIAKRMREHSWIVPAYTLSDAAQSIAVLRIVVREGMSIAMCEKFVDDMHSVVENLRSKKREHAHEQHQHPRC